MRFLAILSIPTVPDPRASLQQELHPHFLLSLMAKGLRKRMPIEILGVLNVVKQRTVRWLLGQRHFELQLFKPLGQGGLGVFVDLFPRLRFAETRMRSIWKLKQDDKVERLRKYSVPLERISLNELRGLNIFLHSSCIFEQQTTSFYGL